MKPYSRIISYKTLKDLLWEFSELVSDKVYEKLNYKMWRDISKNRPLNSDVFLDWDAKGCELTFQGEQVVHYLCPTDGSFGEYLYNAILDNHFWKDPYYPFKDEYLVTATSGKKVAMGEKEKKKFENPDFWGYDGSVTAISKADYANSQAVTDSLTSLSYTAINDSTSTSTKTIQADKICSNIYDGSVSIGTLQPWNPYEGTVEICEDISDKLATKADKADLETLRKQVTEIVNKDKKCANNEKESKKMKFNFDFGPVDGNSVRMSMYGLAIKNRDGVWVSYDSNGKQVMDVEIMNFDGSNFMYKMPVAVKDVKPGDVIVHNRKPMFVSDISKMGITAMDIYEGELKIVVPTSNMFGFNFVTKIVSLVNFGTPTEDQPFGNMLPFLLMSEGKNDKNSMLMMAMAMSGGMNANMMTNPVMMMALMDDKLDTGLLMYLAMQNQMQNQGHCVCGCHDGENK